MGVIYTTLHVFWIPIWITDSPVVCGYINDDNYIEFTEEDVKLISESEQLELNGKVKASFWDRIDGKGVFLGLLILIGVFMKLE
jgi:hypothetical protein